MQIVGGHVLAAGDDTPVAGTVSWVDGVLTDVRMSDASATEEAATTIDASGCWVLPGMIDLHGDAFERCLMPRSGVSFDPNLALQENDAHLLATGITTSFLSATDSWEPGLRSREALRLLVTALAQRTGSNTVVLHVRHERCNTEGHEELMGWIDAGVIQLLSFNDHTPGGIAHITGLSASQIGRSGVERKDLEELQRSAMERRPLGMRQEEELAVAALDAGCRLASHDPSCDADLARDRLLGVSIAEFPENISLAQAYLAEDIDVLLGAPNVVRGGSHLGNLSVRDAVQAEAGSVLCSDYHYPSLLQAPFDLLQAGIVDAGRAWAMVSATPAAAAGLDDRGRIEVGARADVIVVEPPSDGRPARVRTVVAGGTVVFGSA